MYSITNRLNFKMSHNSAFQPTDNGRMERLYKTMKIENKYFLKQNPPEAKRIFST